MENTDYVFMRKYFERKIGSTITKQIITGNDSCYSTYGRIYSFEVLDVSDDNFVLFEINSQDITPNHCIKGGRDKYFGEFKIKFGDISKEKILNTMIKKCNKNFIKEYNIKLA